MDVSSEAGGCRPDQDVAAAAPLLSIIVVVFRDCAELKNIVESLTPFRSVDVEVVVIDGGSQDGSRDFLRESSDKIDYWLSEPDKGLYDGMNKGLRAARGRFFLHINAGDRLLKLPKELLVQSSADVIACRVAKSDGWMFHPRNDWALRFENTWHHQGTFYRRVAHPGYDLQYKVLADFDANQRLRKSGARVELSPEVVASHGVEGISNLFDNTPERFRVIRANFGVASAVAHVARLRFRRLIRPLQRIIRKRSES